jgi:hypothetical protein
VNYSYSITAALADDRRRELQADAERSHQRRTARRARHEARRSQLDRRV